MPTDKKLHMLAGIISGFVSFTMWRMVTGELSSMLIALLITAMIGAMKEGFDKWGGYGGDCDFWDFAATTYGAFIGIVLALIVNICA